MNIEPGSIEDRYLSCLMDYLKGEEESALTCAYELGRLANIQDLSMLELLSAHQSALDSAIRTIKTRSEILHITRIAHRVLAESLASYEMTNRGFKESLSELADTNKALKREINERKNAEEALKESEDRYRTFFENSLDAVLLTSPDGSIQAANAAACRMFGETEEEIIQGGRAGVLDTSDLRLKPALEERARTGRFKGELNMKRKDGAIFPSEISTTLFKDRNDQTRTAMIIRDISERKKAEDDLKVYAKELEAANKELEAFSYSVSHDLRAPLRAMDGFSESLLQDYGCSLDEAGQNYIQRIRKASQTMAQLIDDILKLSRISRTEMFRGIVNLSMMVKVIGEELKANQPKRQAEFLVAPEVIVNGDKNLLQIALNNLLGNAWKYTGKCEKTRIEFGVARQNGETVYFVRDNGVGFDMRYAGKLFQPFQRLHSSKDYPGTGIGLATVQRVIRRHGGRIWAESEIGKGTTFYFTL